jgi:glycosyltransferase involved in cell wall biosynthesis
MIDVTRPTAAEAKLAQRLQAVSDILLGGPPAPDQQPVGGAGAVLDRLVRATQSDPSPDRVWLLCTAVFGAYPSPDDVSAAIRYFQLASAVEAGLWLVARATTTSAALAEEGRRAIEAELRDRRAARRARAGRHPRASPYVARARWVAGRAAARVPSVRRAAHRGRVWLAVVRGRTAQARYEWRRHRDLFLGRPAAPAVSLGVGVGGWQVSELRVVTDRVVVDVNHSSRHDLHTGIQQVVRRTVPIWARDHQVLPVAWTDDHATWRSLSSAESHRVLNRGLEPPTDPSQVTSPVVIVPWRTVVVLAETPPEAACDRLAGLAQYSGNAVVAIGHDCVPVVSADLVPASEPQRFARYLTILKYARRIAGVSNSATEEFGGFSSAVAAQGLAGPTVIECTLPIDAVTLAGPTSDAPHQETPMVLCVGSLEPRKNHLALLYAAERLWREGLAFELLLIAGSGWGNDVPHMITRLRDAGRPITVLTMATDAEVVAAYRRARFTILASLHEGYGLPVAESLSQGTPVITSNYGSTKQIAAGGGALLVDPRDDDAILAGMRALLTDDHLLHTLRDQIQARPTRTWQQYATELWEHLVQPELPAVG